MASVFIVQPLISYGTSPRCFLNDLVEMKAFSLKISVVFLLLNTEILKIELLIYLLITHIHTLKVLRVLIK